MLLAVVLLIATLFGFWWYGGLTDLLDCFRSNHIYDSFTDEEIIEFYGTADSLSEEEEKVWLEDHYQKVFFKMSTKGLIKTLCANYRAFNGPGVLTDPSAEIWYEWLRAENSDFHRLLCEELDRRNNVGRALIDTYQETTYSETTDSASKLAFMEILLLQSKYRAHLPLWKQWMLPMVADEKQREKFAAVSSEDAAAYNAEGYLNLYRYNYLYTDTYDSETHTWREDQVDQHNRKFEYLLPEEYTDWGEDHFVQKIGFWVSANLRVCLIGAFVFAAGGLLVYRRLSTHRKIKRYN